VYVVHKLVKSVDSNYLIAINSNYLIAINPC